MSAASAALQQCDVMGLAEKVTVYFLCLALALQAMKAMSAVGSTLPQLFAEYGAEFTDFVLDQLLTEDLSR